MNPSMARLAAVLATLTLGITAAHGQPAAAPAIPETPEQRDARMGWFRDARFGMFIHWGLYAVPAGKWGNKTNYGEWIMEEAHIPASEYEKFPEQFNPAKFDAKAWVKTAKDAGCGYIVITSKHHDGFGLWPSAQGSWNIASTPFHRDPLQELSEACNEAGIRLCFYHSIMDWHSPYYEPRRAWNDTAAKVSPKPDMDKYVAYLKAQLRELLTNYGPIGILWFDGEWEGSWNDDRGRDLYRYVRSLQPNIIINNRVAKSRTGMAGMSVGEKIGDYGTPEQTIPGTGFPGTDWESCMTMNDHWGYNAADDHFKSTKTLVRNLVDCASKGGNYLLNVGPTAEGLIPPTSVERLAEIGKWMSTNGEAIRGTTASPFKHLPWGRATRKGETLYLHVFDWPADGKLLLPLEGRISNPRILGKSDAKAELGERSDRGVTLTVPTAAPDDIDTVIAVTVQGDINPIQLVPTQGPDGKITIGAEDATLPGDGHVQLETVSKLGPSLGYWTDLSAPSFTFTVKTAGTFDVSLILACDAKSGGSDVLISATGNEADGLSFKVPATKNWHDFQTVPAGKIKLPAGKVTLTFTPKSKPGEGVMNLRSVTLTPAA